ncbi:hypothetical protein ADK52_14670 [Streptomyces sp. WM6372]|nr:hypothetical protein ADK52_14670 [Streptomyces sp. WM6372]
MGVHGYGFDRCTKAGPVPEPRPAEAAEIRITWEGGDNPSVVTADAAGEFETDVTVPSDATARSYDVTALCTVNSKLKATADFQVTPEPEPGPTVLTLDPAEGDVETPVAVTGSGFDGCAADGGRAGTVTLSWDGNPLPDVTPAEVTLDGGAFTAEFAVPSEADSTDHTVTATCVGYEQVSADQRFTVTAAPGPRPQPDPQVTLDPPSLPFGGGSVAITGSGFNCPEVALSWEGEQWDTVAPAGDGTFDIAFDVTPDTSEASYTVRAQCTNDPGVGAEAAFTVNGTGPVPPTPTPPTPPTPTPTPDPTPVTIPVGLVVGSSLLGVALLALAGSAFLSHRHRGPLWVHEHVSSRLRPAPAATDVAEPSETGPPTRTVRLEPHPDPGDQTLKEEGP